jgi:conjugative relaxase-like TrwC/TraI family protein
MMSLHKLSAGSGYTYLTRQVAANDATELGRASLGEYYSERGESPGVWLGRGLEGLNYGPVAGDYVREEQMIALFGHGRHPNAELVEQLAVGAGLTAEAAVARSSLGMSFNVRAGTNAFRRELAERIAAYNQSIGRPASTAVDDQTRAELRTEIGREWFARAVGREPTGPRELSDFITSASRPGTESVAGYDLTFSPVKSISALWALADPVVAREIATAHNDAVRDAFGWLEREASYTRRGHNGARQVDARGLIAVAFTHRDSRARDPDLHTHVAVSNKVQTLDGRWLALDARSLYRAAVAASERYNTRLEAILTERLGVTFADRPSNDGKRPVREVAGVDPALLKFWSARRAAILTRQAELAAEFSRRHGRGPDFAEQTRLFGKATLETRQGKHGPQREADQRRQWRYEAASVLGDDDAVSTMVGRVGATLRPALPPAVRDELDEHWIRWTAIDVIDTVAASYGTWHADVVRAEIERRARYATVPLAAVDAVAEATIAVALSPSASIRLSPADELDEPTGLRRRDGSSVFAVAGSQLYTCEAVLAAESRIVEAAARTDGRAVDPGIVELALLQARADGAPLNVGQEDLVRQLATSGRRVHLALAPAGSGKTTALGVLTRAWSEGGGEVIGLAPTASAAAQLRQAIGTTTDTIAKLLHTLGTGVGPDWITRIDHRTLVIVDEAGAAGTPALDRLISFVVDRGASVRLVGDTRQLGHPGAGGVLRDIAETIGAASLDTLVRFTDPIEGRASLALRVGDPIALGYYLDHDRIHAGDHTTTVEHAYAAWTTDRAAGLDSILLAPTNELVRELNARARADRLAGANDSERAVRLHDATFASAGDTIVSRRNNRRLPISTSDWVKNGDRWFVDQVSTDGALKVTHADTHRSITLPPDYVRRSVELGYATTIHLAQGSTADTSHTMLTGRESREALYVAMSRGRAANHVYLDTSADAAADLLPSFDATRPPTSVELLERILANDRSPRSATTQRRLDDDPALRLRSAVDRYRGAVETSPAGPSAGDRPLPWLPPVPAPDDPAWAEYVTQRAELVRERAAAIDTSAGLPDATWATTLQRDDEPLAHEVAIWRAVFGVPASDFRPCGSPTTESAEHHRTLTARVQAQVGSQLGPTDRWRTLAHTLHPELVDDAHWPVLAAALDRAERAGYDVTSQLPDLVRAHPLPRQQSSRELYWRLGTRCEAAFADVPPVPAMRSDGADRARATTYSAARRTVSPTAARSGPRR